MFKTNAQGLSFNPKDGDEVLIEGRVSVYEASGSYQVYIDKMQLSGAGELYALFEKLKKELQDKGFFAEDKKKQLPKYPKTIGIITSPTGAAVRDCINTIKRRYPISKVIVYPALVQGENAKDSIAKLIDIANIDKLCDVLIVGRGGGSIEDLWAFNEEIVVKAIYNSKIPIISAVGHETDTTLSDYVSDMRAPTPTAGAELATPNIEELISYINDTVSYLNSRARKILEEKHINILNIEKKLELLSPITKIKHNHQLLNSKIETLNSKIKHYITNNRSKIEKYNTLLNKSINTQLIRSQSRYNNLIGKLDVINPLKTLSRGYSVVSKNNTQIKSVASLNENDDINIRFVDGIVKANVNTIKKDDTYE